MQRHFPFVNLKSFLSSSSFLVTLLSCFLVLAIVSSCTDGSKFQPDSMHWLQFRGEGALGIAPGEAMPPIHFSADTNLLWKTEVLPGWSSPCIVNDRIYLTGFDQEDSLLYTFAVCREKGDILWRDSVRLEKSYFIHPTTTHANPTVASNGEMIFSHFPAYGLLAHDLDGNRAWEFTHEILSQSLYGGSASPVIADNVVILLVNSETDPRIVGLDLETGDSNWVFRAEGMSWAPMMSNATPVIHDDLLIMHLFGTIAALNLSTMETEWWLNTLTTAIGSPVVKDDVIYINTWAQLGEKRIRGEVLSFSEFLERCDKNGNKRVERDEIDDDLLLFSRVDNPDDLFSTMHYKDDLTFTYFDANQDQAFDEQEWNAAVGFLQAYVGDHGMMAVPVDGSGERPVMDISWKITEHTPESPSPLVVGENVLFIDDGGYLSIIHRVSGQIMYEDKLGAPGAYFSSPLLAGNLIYTCAHNGTVTVLSADDFSILAQNKFKEKIGASPVAVDNVLYIRTDKHLYAFREI